MTSFGALYDACVLYPAPLRDLLMHLALTDLYRANHRHENDETTRKYVHAFDDERHEEMQKMKITY